MKKEIFYIGDGKDETLQTYLEGKKDGFTYTAGFCVGEEWFVLVDRIAIEIYKDMATKPIAKSFSSFLENKLQNKKIGSLDELLNELKSGKEEDYPVEETKVNEDKLIEKIIYEVNDSVLHEVALHICSELVHDHLIKSIRFTDKCLNKEKALHLVKKYSLIKNCDIWHSKEKGGVTQLHFKNVGRQREKIEALYNELKSYNLKLKVAYKRKEYPIEFGLDDIRIIKKDDTVNIGYIFKEK